MRQPTIKQVRLLDNKPKISDNLVSHPSLAAILAAPITKKTTPKPLGKILK